MGPPCPDQALAANRGQGPCNTVDSAVGWGLHNASLAGLQPANQTDCRDNGIVNLTSTGTILRNFLSHSPGERKVLALIAVLSGVKLRQRS
jgi:hypothetical protein